MARNSQNIQWVISGVSDLSAFVRELKPSAQARIIRKTLEDASAPIVRLAKQKAPKKSGALRKSIGVVVRAYPAKGTVTGFIGARRGTYAEMKNIRTKRKTATLLKPGQNTMKRITPANYSHLVEYGHRSVHGGGTLPNFGERVPGVWNAKNKGRSQRKGTISATSFVPPRPFLRPAFEQGRAFAEARIIDGFEKAIEREYARAKAKLSKTIKLAA